jgi:hypothetical protein
MKPKRKINLTKGLEKKIKKIKIKLKIIIYHKLKLNNKLRFYKKDKNKNKIQS